MRNIKINFLLVSIFCINLKLFSAQPPAQDSHALVQNIVMSSLKRLSHKQKLISGAVIKDFICGNGRLYWAEGLPRGMSKDTTARSANDQVVYAMGIAEYLYDNDLLEYIRANNDALRLIKASNDPQHSISTFDSAIIAAKAREVLRAIKDKKKLLKAARHPQLLSVQNQKKTFFALFCLAGLFTAKNYDCGLGQSWISVQNAALVTGVLLLPLFETMRRELRLSQPVDNQEARDALIVERANKK